MYITKLKNTSFFRTLINNFLYVALSYILLAFTIRCILLIIIYIIFIIYVNKHNKELFKIIIIFDIIYIILYLISYFIFKDLQLTEFTGIVTSIEKKDKSLKIEVTNFFRKIICYDKNFTNLSIGNKVVISGENSKIYSNHNQYAFNYLDYRKSKKIVSIINANQIEVYKSINIYNIKKYIYDYIDYFFSDSISKNYILGFIFGDTTFLSDEIQESIKINGISHLFAISGLHVSIIIDMIDKLFKKVISNETKRENFISIILGVYLFVNYFQVSIARAIIMYYLKIINKRYELNLLSTDIISICFIIFLLLNPYLVLNISFKLSFLASFIIIIYNESIKNSILSKQNTIIKDIIMTLVVQILTLPITVDLNNSFNIISCFINVIFIALVSYIILPFTFLTLFVPILDIVYKNVLVTFENLNIFFKNISSNSFINFNIRIPSFSNIEIIIFYVLIYFIIIYYKNIKIYITTIILIFIFMNKTSFNVFGKVAFLSLPEGDSILIDLPFNEGIVLIDTGIYNNSNTIDYLYSQGIRKIDYLILTHNHSDHNGNASDIITNINVNKVVISAYDNSKYKDLEKTIKVKKGDVLKLGNTTFEIIYPVNQSDNENDNSIVIKTKLGNYNYLFLGDATKRVEESLDIKELGLENVDIVKIGHHGSNTSTSSNFINAIKPKYAIITSGYNNKYGFPHKETINNLNNITIYDTKESDQITIYYSFIKSIICKLR